ncbi:hypothetical protein [Salipaludibacillus sp. CF4.18]|uniref:hypothetical protein n=1 Tax=Salipaludibacillus sp. CF4.18 TaxID=3373081 RepID=UPI003EE64FB5
MGRKRFTDEQVLAMCKNYANGDKSMAELANENGVTGAAVRDILVFYTYTKVTLQLDDEIKKAIEKRRTSNNSIGERNKNNRKHSNDDVERLYHAVLHDKMIVSEIAKELGMTRETATAILKGRMYADVKPNLTPEEEYRLKNLSTFSHEKKGYLTEEQVRAIYKEFVETDIIISRIAIKYAVNNHVIAALLQGQSYIHIFDSLPNEEIRKINGAIKSKKGNRPSVTTSRLTSAERDYKILKGVLTTNKPYSHLAREVGVDPSYISHLLGERLGKMAWDMLNRKEVDYLREIKNDSSYRKQVVEKYRGI